MKGRKQLQLTIQLILENICFFPFEDATLNPSVIIRISKISIASSKFILEIITY